MAQAGLGLAVRPKLAWDWLCSTGWPRIGCVAQDGPGLAVWPRMALDWLCAQAGLGLAV